MVEKRKVLQKQVADLNDELSNLRKHNGDMQHLAKQCDELQTSNLVLRRQMAKFQDTSMKLETTLTENSQMVQLGMKSNTIFAVLGGSFVAFWWL